MWYRNSDCTVVELAGAELHVVWCAAVLVEAAAAGLSGAVGTLAGWGNYGR